MFVVKAVWDHDLNTCRVASTNPALLNITFFFSEYVLNSHFFLLTRLLAMAFDFVILSTTAVAVGSFMLLFYY